MDLRSAQPAAHSLQLSSFNIGLVGSSHFFGPMNNVSANGEGSWETGDRWLLYDDRQSLAPKLQRKD
jgi:hypothetical protein